MKRTLRFSLFYFALPNFKLTATIISFFGAFILIVPAAAQKYRWLENYDSSSTIAASIQPPEKYERPETTANSFAEWVRNLPLKSKNASVTLYNGRNKANQSVHWRVLDIDIGDKDLQQCADAIIRLRAEYYYSRSAYDSIRFNMTSGDALSFREWINGIRPEISGNDVNWIETGEVDSSYKSFRRYLRLVFTYAGTYSLAKQLRPKSNPCEIEIGDVFIQGGFPGHAVMVVDIAVNPDTGKRIFLLAQSYMPTQDIHILKNPRDSGLSPWYDCDFGDRLITPEWTFNKSYLKEF